VRAPPGSRDLVEEGLEKSRHRAVPLREDDCEETIASRASQRVSGQMTRSKSSCVQDREIEARHLDPRDLVAEKRSTYCVGVG
jgi:hypothetical protein